MARKDKPKDDGKEVLNLKANVVIELFGPDGKLKDVRKFHNLICTAGKNAILSASAAKKVSDFAYCAIGTNTTAANAADTTLGTENARSSIITPTNPTANTIQFQTTFAAGTGTGAITESGLLDTAVSGGNLLAHQVFSVINKGASDTLQVTWQIT